MSLGFTRMTDYALVALAALAEQSARDDRPLSARQIAGQYILPPHLLMNVLKQLHSAGLVRSRRGAGGGYWSNCRPDQISVADVVEAIEGPVKLMPCCEPDEHNACLECRLVPNCPITGSIRQMNQVVIRLLRQITLLDLMNRSPHPGMADQAHETAPSPTSSITLNA